MEDYKMRVVEEYAELTHRHFKLQQFLAKPPAELDPAEHARLVTQSQAMLDYRLALRSRIAAF